MKTDGMCEGGKAFLEVCQAGEAARQQVLQNLKETLQQAREECHVEGDYLDEDIYGLYS